MTERSESETTPRAGLPLRMAAAAGRGLKATWAIVGITLALVIGIELASGLVLAVRDAFNPARPPEVDVRAYADAYHDAPWAEDYFREFAAAQRVRWEPYVYWRRFPFSGRFINVDERGIRRTVQSVGAQARNAEPLTVFVFGGSTTWGTGARDQATIPSLLGAELARRGITAEITNFGETGWVSTQEAIAFMLELRAGRIPDLAVFYDGNNDLFAAYQSGEAGIPMNEENRRQELNLMARHREYVGQALAGGLANTSTVALARRLAFKVGILDSLYPPAEVFDRSGLEQAVIDAYFANVDLVRAMAADHGVATVFFWQPVLFEKELRSPYEESVYSHRPQELRQFYRSAYRLLRERRSERAIHDLSGVFDDTAEPFYIDFCHLAEEGNRVVAEAMAGPIVEALAGSGALERPVDPVPAASAAPAGP